MHRWCHWGELSVYEFQISKTHFKLGKFRTHFVPYRLEFNAIGVSQRNRILLAVNPRDRHRHRWDHYCWHWRRSSLTLTITRFAGDLQQLELILILLLWESSIDFQMLLLSVLITIWPGCAGNSYTQHTKILKQRMTWKDSF